jgi:hypothetical protein
VTSYSKLTAKDRADVDRTCHLCAAPLNYLSLHFTEDGRRRHAAALASQELTRAKRSVEFWEQALARADAELVLAALADQPEITAASRG